MNINVNSIQKIRFVAIIGVCLVVSAIIGFQSMPPVYTSAQAAITPTPTLFVDPTLTEILTPFPTGGATFDMANFKPVDMSEPTPGPYEEPPTPQPSNPYFVETIIDRGATIEFATNYVEIIAIGTIEEILPARWNALDGQRPADPFTTGGGIFRPMRVRIEKYWKGTQEDTLLYVYLPGGQVGQDQTLTTDGNLNLVNVGDSGIFFLRDWGQTFEGETIWAFDDRYTISDDGMATSTATFQSVALEQLRTIAEESEVPE